MSFKISMNCLKMSADSICYIYIVRRLLADYLQNLCFPIVLMYALDHIHELVAVFGLK